MRALDRIGEIIDRIRYFGKTSSTDVLKTILSEGKKQTWFSLMEGYLKKTVTY